MGANPPYARQVIALLADHLPVEVESDGSQEDWNVIGPALLAGAATHLDELAKVVDEGRSGLIAWQLLRGLYEYVTTFAWVAADPTARTRRWLKSDYQQRLTFDGDFRRFGEPLLSDERRAEIEAYGSNVPEMPALVDRAEQADERWAPTVVGLGGLPNVVGDFRALYRLIYRRGSQYTHPSSHAVDLFVGGAPPRLMVGRERALERDLPMIGASVLAIGACIASEALPSLGLTVDEVLGSLA